MTLDSDNVVTLAHASGSNASVTTYGAQVLSWIDSEARERIYLSRLAQAGGSPIRGGIPVIFPQFGTGPLPKHGLLRTRRWSLENQTESTAEFSITDDPDTRSLWPYPFLAELRVELSATLSVRLSITNSGESQFTFAAALHNYFAIDSIDLARVRGLASLTYIDKTTGGTEAIERSPELQVCAETDRIYLAGPREVSIDCAIRSSSTSITARGFSDWVVWNPWSTGSATLTDMGPEDYQHMLCVEAARVTELVQLDPGKAWVGEEVISVT